MRIPEPDWIIYCHPADLGATRIWVTEREIIGTVKTNLSVPRFQVWLGDDTIPHYLVFEMPWWRWRARIWDAVEVVRKMLS